MAEITREHLEMAALAAGKRHVNYDGTEYDGRDGLVLVDGIGRHLEDWRQHLDDGDAARLCAKLQADTAWGANWVSVTRLPAADVVERHDGTEPDKLRAWREAVTLCAAAVGERMRKGGV